MGLIRRNKKGSDSIIQNTDKWEMVNEGVNNTRSDIDFTKIDIPQADSHNMQEEATALAPEAPSALPEKSSAVKDEEKKLSKPWIKHFDAYIMKKFLGTFFCAIILLRAVVIIFDHAHRASQGNGV